MATVTSFTAERMQEIEDTTVVDGTVDGSGHLLLEQRNGTQIDAGYVKGPQGEMGPEGLPGINGPRGFQGFQGPQGAQGAQGYQGAGSQGAQGSPGLNDLGGIITTVIYTASGSFDKASYPGATGIRVRVQAGGGGGGGVTSSAAGATASGGGAGGYGEAFIPLASLGTSETVTVGGAGTAGASGSANGVAAGTGGTSSFGAHVVCTGGAGGVAQVGATNASQVGGAGGTVSGSASMLIPQTGKSGGPSWSGAASAQHVGGGGDSPFGNGAVERHAVATAAASTGTAGIGYGSGGGGAVSSGNAQGNAAGGAGTAGIVIVDVFGSVSGTAPTLTTVQPYWGRLNRTTQRNLSAGVDYGSVFETQTNPPSGSGLRSFSTFHTDNGFTIVEPGLYTIIIRAVGSATDGARLQHNPVVNGANLATEISSLAAGTNAIRSTWQQGLSAGDTVTMAITALGSNFNSCTYYMEVTGPLKAT